MQALEARISSPDEMLKRTLEVWGKRSARPLNMEDARQIAENATGFFRVLIEWKVRRADTSVRNDRFAA
jgi:hypothetical protein